MNSSSGLPEGAYIGRGQGPRPQRWQELANLGIFTLAVTGGLAGFGIFLIHLATDPLADARAYYDAAHRLNDGLPLYPAGADPDVADFYRYPPLLAIVLRPLALLPYEAFALLWASAVLASFVVLVRRLGMTRRAWLALGVLGLPIGWSIAIAQAQVPMTLLLLIGQPWSIALAANIKLFPILAAVWWLGRRRWQALGALAGWLIVLGLAQVLLEPTNSLAFLGTLNLEQVGANVRNVSPYVISPILWVGLLGAGLVAAIVAAPTRWGWPAAVALASLAYPRLLLYMLMSFLAAVREPDEPAAEKTRFDGAT